MKQGFLVAVSTKKEKNYAVLEFLVDGVSSNYIVKDRRNLFGKIEDSFAYSLFQTNGVSPLTVDNAIFEIIDGKTLILKKQINCQNRKTSYNLLIRSTKNLSNTHIPDLSINLKGSLFSDKHHYKQLTLEDNRFISYIPNYPISRLPYHAKGYTFFKNEIQNDNDLFLLEKNADNEYELKLKDKLTC